MSDLNVIGVLVMRVELGGEQHVECLSPNELFITLPPSATPPAWYPVVRELAKLPDLTVLGLLASGGLL